MFADKYIVYNDGRRYPFNMQRKRSGDDDEVCDAIDELLRDAIATGLAVGRSEMQSDIDWAND